MKTVLPSSVCVLICMIVFSSCMGNLRIEKRHYRDGFYLGGSKQRHSSTSDSTTGKVNEKCIAPVNSGESGPNDRVTADTNSTIATTASVYAHDTAIRSAVEEKSMQEHPLFIPDGVASEIPPVEVPEEARRLNVLSWVALALLVLGVIASIVAFMPFVAAGFGVLIAAAPFLVLGALGLGIWVMVTARRRKLSAGSAELGNYYDQLRKRARLIVVLASTVIVLFVLFLALVIAALSTFQ